MEFNLEQKAAIDTRKGYWAVQAGPGSGKTAVLIARYQALINEGIKPQDILCLTFTDKASREMRQRAGAEALKEHAKHERPSGFRTFHSLALAFADLEREHWTHPLADMPLAPPAFTMKILSKLAKHYGLPNYKPLANWISEQKRHGIRPDQILAMDVDRYRLKEAYALYQKSLADKGLLDFDDLILEMRKLLSNHQDILKRWSYRYISVDEFQDTDRQQFEVVKLLAQKHGNLFVVGDYNQNIFEWRGSDPSLLANFIKLFPTGKVLYLANNYRSSEEIVEIVRKLAPCPGELSEKFCSQNGHGPQPTIMGYPSPHDEALAVVKNYLANAPKSAAILSRTNLGLRPFEEMCAQENVKYFLLGGSGFWSQGEVRQVMAFVQCIEFPNIGAIQTAIRSPYEPVRYIKKMETIRRLKAAFDKNTSVHGLLMGLWPDHWQQNELMYGLSRYLLSLSDYKQSPPDIVIASILQDLRAEEYHEENDIPEIDNSPLDNLRELVKIAHRFNSVKEFLAYARRCANNTRTKSGLALGTVHSAKGLQFGTVYATGVNEGMFPHEKSDNIDEEKRILFVMVSRPQQYLHISYSGPISRFLVNKFSQGAL
jgi:DNA helicase-2/ATP-dependent DNA helicase PcrA